jgi:hypothetical protein
MSILRGKIHLFLRINFPHMETELWMLAHKLSNLGTGENQNNLFNSKTCEKVSCSVARTSESTAERLAKRTDLSDLQKFWCRCFFSLAKQLRRSIYFGPIFIVFLINLLRNVFHHVWLIRYLIYDTFNVCIPIHWKSTQAWKLFWIRKNVYLEKLIGRYCFSVWLEIPGFRPIF